MTQVVLNVNNQEKWDALEKMSEQELALLRQAENDKENGRLTAYTSHRDILGR